MTDQTQQLEQTRRIIRKACVEIRYLARWMEFRRANRGRYETR